MVPLVPCVVPLVPCVSEGHKNRQKRGGFPRFGVLTTPTGALRRLGYLPYLGLGWAPGAWPFCSHQDPDRDWVWVGVSRGGRKIKK